MAKLSTWERRALLGALQQGGLPASEIEAEQAQIRRFVQQGLLRESRANIGASAKPLLVLTTKGKREARRS